MSSDPSQTHHRGSIDNPVNRFERLSYEPNPDVAPEEAPAPSTQFYEDQTRSIIVYNQSPDVGFSASINPYRGCEHGCCYCYARPTHEYLGLSAGRDFETQILVKKEAAKLLRRELSSPRWKPQPLGLSGVTDCYQPIERRLQITRQCLEVLAEFRNPVAIVTKNHLVTRDVDLLTQLAKHQACAVFLSINSLNTELRQHLEPRTSPHQGRLQAIETLSQAGIPTGVMVAPVIPGLTDHEIPTVLETAAKAGARCAGYIMLRLPYGLKELFEAWLDRHFPKQKDRVLGRIREVRGGKLNDTQFSSRMAGQGVFADMVAQLFSVACRKVGIPTDFPSLSTRAFRGPEEEQLTLF